MKNFDDKTLITTLAQGKIIAYPTESVWGLGVDAMNQNAVEHLNLVKGRPCGKSFIVLVPEISCIDSWIAWDQIPRSTKVMDGWPGPITKLLPIGSGCPLWLGLRGKIAIRISAHPEVQEILSAFKKPLISTSANISGQPPLSGIVDIKKAFDSRVDYIVDGKPGGMSPTQIIDIMSGMRIR